MRFRPILLAAAPTAAIAGRVRLGLILENAYLQFVISTMFLLHILDRLYHTMISNSLLLSVAKI